MPNFITHSIHGLEVLNVSLSKASNIFLFGCQGADFFFYKDSKFGEMLHKDSSGEFLSHLVKNSKTEFQRLYTTGYICHVTLDEIAHPYINYRTRTSKDHTKFEFIIDTVLLERSLKKSWDYKFIEHFKVDKRSLKEISKLYIESFKSVFGIEIDHGIIERNYRSMISILEFFYDPNRRKTILVNLIKWLSFTKFDYTFMIYPVIDEKKFPDPLNLAKKPWLDSHGIERTDSFMELLQAAVNEAKKLKDQLFSTTF